MFTSPAGMREQPGRSGTVPLSENLEAFLGDGFPKAGDRIVESSFPGRAHEDVKCAAYVVTHQPCGGFAAGANSRRRELDGRLPHLRRVDDSADVAAGDPRSGHQLVETRGRKTRGTLNDQETAID